MDIYKVEQEVNSLDKIKIQKLVSWLTHKDIAIAALLFSEVTGKNLMDNIAKNGRKIVEEEIEKYSDSYEQYIPTVLVTIQKYIDLINSGKSIETLDD